MTKRDISSHSRDKFVVRHHCHRVICNFTRDINEQLPNSIHDELSSVMRCKLTSRSNKINCEKKNQILIVVLRVMVLCEHETVISRLDKLFIAALSLLMVMQSCESESDMHVSEFSSWISVHRSSSKTSSLCLCFGIINT